MQFCVGGNAGLNAPNKNVDHYSGILECPCNSRVGGDPEFYPNAKTKILTHSFEALPQGTCKQGFRYALGCYDAVASLGFNATSITNKTANDASQPEGCLFVPNSDGSATALFNQGGHSKGCAASTTKTAQLTSPVTKVTVGITLGTEATVTISGPSDKWFGIGLDASAMEDQPYTWIVNSSGVNERKLGTEPRD